MEVENLFYLFLWKIYLRHYSVRCSPMAIKVKAFQDFKKTL